MPDGLKSVAAAAVLLFVMYVVLEGEPVRRVRCLFGSEPCLAAGRRSITFCNGWLAELPLLEMLPCFALNLIALFGVVFGMLATVAVIRLAGSELRR